jgi:hypothetical protein
MCNREAASACPSYCLHHKAGLKGWLLSMEPTRHGCSRCFSSSPAQMDQPAFRRAALSFHLLDRPLVKAPRKVGGKRGHGPCLAKETKFMQSCFFRHKRLVLNRSVPGGLGRCLLLPPETKRRTVEALHGRLGRMRIPSSCGEDGWAVASRRSVGYHGMAWRRRRWCLSSRCP